MTAPKRDFDYLKAQTSLYFFSSSKLEESNGNSGKTEETSDSSSSGSVSR